MKASILIAAVLVSGLSAWAQARDTQDIYNKTCIACHASGVAGAPKTGDSEAWKSRLALGIDALVVSAKNGKGAMPPRGLCADCTDEEFKSLITLMSTAK